ncbi:hypothetical protein G6K91_00050 [Agrobacterium rhizogenes]|nr:hypothetical protein [Rhizobium rhizogenes]NTG51909.1 hypothetical protein [Rhizobium rhizogenes]NTG97614.1 hypothetical protein [Rhizobium rhizogenes]NTI53329.1 hypothetical protein [Rhizobium rhizogenes]
MTQLAKDFKRSLNYDHLRLEHQSYLKKLNDVLFETALAIQGMESVLSEVSARLAKGQKSYSIQVPNKLAKLIPIRRNLAALQATLSGNAPLNAYVRSIVFLITLAEDYLAANIRRVLRAYPQKLMISTKGKKLGDSDQYTIDVRDLLAAGSLDAVIEQLAAQRVRDAVYATPQQYLTYFKAVCGVEFKEATWREYVEIKATRDLFVHADGRVNEIYLEKAGQQARFGLGEKVTVDPAYFNATTSCLKALMSEIYTGLRAKFANSVELKKVFDSGNLPFVVE